jgi:hypothetical protein
MQRRNTGKWLPLSIVLIAFCFLHGAFAQETTAGLLGVVKDPSGASVAKANIEVTSPNLMVAISGLRPYLQAPTPSRYRLRDSAPSSRPALT